MDETPTSRTTWFGFERVRVDYKNHAVDITVGSESAWDRSHLRRLRQSSDLPGHVPVIDADVSSEGRPYVVTAAVQEPTLAELMASKKGIGWNDSTGIVTAVARACHEAHERGLFHGSLSADDVYVIDEEIAVDGLGLTKGGEIPASRKQWVAPEVLAGDNPTARSDVYSLGKLLEAALGDAADLVPRSVKRLIMWSSSETPEARPRSASEFAEILSDGLGENKNTFRPAFIPTIRANNLTADAEKAVADTTTKSTNGAEEDISTRKTQSEKGDSTAASKATSKAADSDADKEPQGASLTDHDDSDDTGKLKTVDLDDVPSEKSTESELASAKDKKATDKTVDNGKKSGAKAAAGVAGVGAVAAAASAKKISGKAKPETETIKVTPKKAAATSAATTVADSDDEGSWTRYIVPIIGCAAIPLLLWFFLSMGGSNDADETATPAPATSEDDTDGTDDSDPERDVSQVAPPASEAVETTPTTVEDETSTEGPETTSEKATTTAAPTTTVAAEPADEPEPEPEPEPATDEPVSAISAADAAVQVVHGIPGAPADIYVDGDLTAPGFQPENVAGPVKLFPGPHDIAVFAAADDPALTQNDRTDEPLVAETITTTNDATTLVAHLDEAGTPSLSGFLEPLESLDAGESRVSVRNLVVGSGNANITVDGEPQAAVLSNGDELEVTLSPGDHIIGLTTEDGETFESSLDLLDGELTTVSFIGSFADSTESIVQQRYSGLASAPTAVPTGDSGLLGSDDGPGTALPVFGLALVLVAGGAVIARRRRSFA